MLPIWCMKMNIFVVFVAFRHVCFWHPKCSSRALWKEKPAPENASQISGVDLLCRFLARVSQNLDRFYLLSYSGVTKIICGGNAGVAYSILEKSNWVWKWGTHLAGAWSKRFFFVSEIGGHSREKFIRHKLQRYPLCTPNLVRLRLVKVAFGIAESSFSICCVIGIRHCFPIQEIPNSITSICCGLVPVVVQQIDDKSI